MKKFLVSLIGAACFTVIVASCNKKEGVEVAPTQEKESISEIDLMEKEEGVKYFKKDVTLMDASGKNKIVMRFAAVDEDALDYYLSVREHTVILDPETGKGLGVSKVDLMNKNPQNTGNEIGAGRIRVVSEVLSKQLEKSVVGYGIHVSTKNVINARSAVTYNFYETRVCDSNWPETLTMTVYSNGVNSDCFPRLTWGLDVRINWTASWYTPSGRPWDNFLLIGIRPMSWLPCTNRFGNNCSTAVVVQGIDGPWRTRFNAQWDQEYTWKWYNDTDPI
ncbi:MAG: hypothetical protein EAZ46_09295 [Runella sp.]|nr:MAG: hypothetical protein EAZ46_09295 [Runella sp.]